MSQKHSDTEGADSGTHTYHVSYCTVIVCTYVWALSIVYVKASYEYDHNASSVEGGYCWHSNVYVGIDLLASTLHRLHNPP